MIIGVPKEIKNNENRAALTPAGAEALCAGGHTLFIEKGAGIGSGFADETYTGYGAAVVSDKRELFARAEMIMKVKEPLPPEYDLFREGQVLFTYLHLAAEPEQTKALLAKKVTGIAYETLGVTRMRIAMFTTGGTFDKEYNELSGELYFKQTHVPEMLALGRSRIPVRLQTLMMKDSLCMTTADRQEIASACRQAKERRIVITHGTDTMENTACFLAKNVSDKTVVLTGAMIPYKFGSSDGLFNLGGALALAQVLPPGIYVAMNGRCFPWNSVTKNRHIGVFEEKQPPTKPFTRRRPLRRA